MGPSSSNRNGPYCLRNRNGPPSLSNGTVLPSRSNGNGAAPSSNAMAMRPPLTYQMATGQPSPLSYHNVPCCRHMICQYIISSHIFHIKTKSFSPYHIRSYLYHADWAGPLGARRIDRVSARHRSVMPLEVWAVVVLSSQRSEDAN